MERKLHKKELDLWKEVTKEDIKINSYLQDDMTEKKSDFIKKNPEVLKKYIKIKKKKNNFYKNEKASSENKLQVNKRMKAKFERGLIRPEAVLDLHGYNRIDAEKTLKSFT